MARDERERETGSFELDNFERNRYFQGKLMTARDLKDEQTYHVNRLETLTRSVDGMGIVTGLTVSEFSVSDGTLTVTIEPGLAIDEDGQPIVVRSPATESFDPSGDELYLYIKYNEEKKDPVPLPGEQPVSDAASKDSRVLETFEVYATATSPATYKTPNGVGVDDVHEPGADPTDTAHSAAHAYQRQREQERHGGETLFLAAFERNSDDEWVKSDATQRRPYVYDNDMLFDLLVAHVTNEEDAHGGLSGGGDAGTDVLGANHIDTLDDRLGDVQATVEETSAALEGVGRHSRLKALKSVYGQLDDLAGRFEGHDEISPQALDIAQDAKAALQEDRVDEDPEAFRSFVEELAPKLRSLGENLETEVEPYDHESYVRDLETLDEQLEEVEGNTEPVSRTLDIVAEKIELLEPLVTPRNAD